MRYGQLNSSPKIISEVSSARARISGMVRKMIFNDEIKPNARIDQTALAEKIGVGKGSIREALSVLESRGYIVWSPGMGACRKTFYLEDIIQLMEVRRPLEVLSAKLACHNLTSANKRTLDNCCKDITESFVENKISLLRDLHISYHQMLAEMSGNWHLARVLEAQSVIVDVMTAMYKIRITENNVVDDYILDSHRNHFKLTEAIASGDEGLAVAAMEEHLYFDWKRWEERYGLGPFF